MYYGTTHIQPQHTLHDHHHHHILIRERQKERVKTMEDSLGALTDQVHSLSMEVKQLATQNSVLEKVLKLRNETIDKYQNDNNVC